MKIVGAHSIDHSCAPGLLKLSEELDEGIVYGIVVECDSCKQTWMRVPDRPWLRRDVFDGDGWWIREPRRLRRERGDGIEEGLDVLLVRAKAGRP